MKLLVGLNKKDILDYLDYTNSFIIGLKGFSINYQEYSVEEIKELLGKYPNIEVFVSINKNIFNSDLKELENKGFIRKENSKFRTIELLVDNEFDTKVSNNEEEVVSVPLLGRVACGNPSEAIENPNDFFSLPASLIPSRESIFTLQCSGDSMIDAGIFDGDIVIVQKQERANNGELVVAMTDEGDVTLKRLFVEEDHVRLQPENEAYSPIILTNVRILGKAIGLYRKI